MKKVSVSYIILTFLIISFVVENVYAIECNSNNMTGDPLLGSQVGNHAPPIFDESGMTFILDAVDSDNGIPLYSSGTRAGTVVCAWSNLQNKWDCLVDDTGDVYFEFISGDTSAGGVGHYQLFQVSKFYNGEGISNLDPSKGYFFRIYDTKYSTTYIGKNGQQFASEQDVKKNAISFGSSPFCTAYQKQPTCTDSDDGMNYFVKGTCRDSEGSIKSDICTSGKKLNEYYCDNLCLSMQFTCPEVSICRNGNCINYTCIDSDNGNSIHEKGHITVKEGEYEYTYEDHCSLDRVYIIEYVCEEHGEIPFYELPFQKCPNGCENGACKTETKCSYENEFCGGIAGIPCCHGLICKPEGRYPDASGKCVKPTFKCFDSDGGKNYYSKGSCTDSNGAFNDSCSNGKIKEYYCDTNSNCAVETLDCPSGFTCQDGYCVSQPSTCSDIDGGLNYLLKGTTTGILQGGDPSPSTWEDSCDGNNLYEYFCDGNFVNYQVYECPDKCYDGTCFTCTDSDNGNNLFEWGWITFEGVGYYNSTLYDHCSKFGTYIIEQICEEDEEHHLPFHSNEQRCPAGHICENDICVNKTEPVPGLGVIGAKICTQDCENLPVPTFKVCLESDPDCEPIQETMIEIWLENFPLLTFVMAPIQNSWNSDEPNVEVTLIDGAGVTTSRGVVHNIDGAYKVRFLFGDITANPPDIFIWRLQEPLIPGKNITIRYKFSTTEDSLGGVYLYKKEGDIFEYDLSEAKSELNKISIDEDSILDQSHVFYEVYLIPMALALHSEGNFYLGDGMISINTGDGTLSGVQQEMTHEYNHALFFNSSIRTQYKNNCLLEGLADAMIVHLGYETSEAKFSCGSAGEPADCLGQDECLIYTEPHNKGNCLFAYLYNEILFSNNLFRGIFHPQHNFNFDSCDYDNRITADSLLVLLSESTGQDLTDLLKNKVKLNTSETLEDAINNIEGVEQTFGEQALITETQECVKNSDCPESSCPDGFTLCIKGRCVFPECEEKIQTPGECGGCLMGDDCIPFGYRKDNYYCDISRKFKEQKRENEDCKNNFECKTNICINDKCVPEGLWQQFLDWFYSIFGFL